MSLIMDQGFERFLTGLRPTRPDSSQLAKTKSTIERALAAKFDIDGISAGGSFEHGSGVSGFSRLDYFVSMRTAKPKSSAAVLCEVFLVLQEKFPDSYVRIAVPAVVVELGEGYESVEVIPAYSNGKTDETETFFIPGITSEWLEISPAAQFSHLEDRADEQIKDFVVLVKAWKYYRNVPISSFYLEMRAVAYLESEEAVCYPLDLYRFFNRLRADLLAPLPDPTGLTGPIQPCANDIYHRDALSKLDLAIARAEKAKDAYLADDAPTAFAYWNQLFNGRFPSSS